GTRDAQTFLKKEWPFMRMQCEEQTTHVDHIEEIIREVELCQVFSKESVANVAYFAPLSLSTRVVSQPPLAFQSQNVYLRVQLRNVQCPGACSAHDVQNPLKAF